MEQAKEKQTYELDLVFQDNVIPIVEEILKKDTYEARIFKETLDSLTNQIHEIKEIQTLSLGNFTVRLDKNKSGGVRIPNPDFEILTPSVFSFGCRPCLFKDGKVISYLDMDTLERTENGEASDIYYMSEYDVMIEFPRRGISIQRPEGRDVIYVSFTESSDDPNFNYDAFTGPNGERLDAFYLGAYLGSIDYTGALRSLSGVQPKSCFTKEEFLDAAHKRGKRYGIMTEVQFVYLQSLFLLYWGDRTCNAKNMIPTKHNRPSCTGTKDPYSMILSPNPTRFCGLEDLWGNYYHILDDGYAAYSPFGITRETVRMERRFSDITDPTFIDISQEPSHPADREVIMTVVGASYKDWGIEPPLDAMFRTTVVYGTQNIVPKRWIDLLSQVGSRLCYQ